MAISKETSAGRLWLLLTQAKDIAQIEESNQHRSTALTVSLVWSEVFGVDEDPATVLQLHSKMLSLACAEVCLPNLNLTTNCALHKLKVKNKKKRHKKFFILYLFR